MAKHATYEVLTQHFGDKQYWEGDERKMLPADAKDLVRNGVLKLKRAPQLKNKMQPAPSDKAAG